MVFESRVAGIVFFGFYGGGFLFFLDRGLVLFFFRVYLDIGFRMFFRVSVVFWASGLGRLRFWREVVVGLRV